MSQKIKVHPFESAGLGVAPFRCVGFYEMPSPALAEQNPSAYAAALAEIPIGFGVGSCAFCGAALVNNYLIESRDGRSFAVGSTCVAKTTATFDALAVDVRKREIERRRAIRDARAKARAAATAEKLERERPERERREREQKALDDQLEAAHCIANGFLLRALARVPYQSAFVEGISRDLHRRLAYGLPEKALRILADIYAKVETDGARRNSKEFFDAVDAFNGFVDEQRTRYPNGIPFPISLDDLKLTSAAMNDSRTQTSSA